MIRQAAAYATAASIGSLVGTMVGTIVGAALVIVVNAKKPTVITDITNGFNSEQEPFINGS